MGEGTSMAAAALVGRACAFGALRAAWRGDGERMVPGAPPWGGGSRLWACLSWERPRSGNLRGTQALCGSPQSGVGGGRVCPRMWRRVYAPKPGGWVCFVPEGSGETLPLSTTT